VPQSLCFPTQITTDVTHMYPSSSSSSPLTFPSSHLMFAASQKGFIVTNTNCSTTGYVIPLAALENAFGAIEAVLVKTMQATSNAIYPGVVSLNILDKIIPHISGEEKIEWKTLKMLGAVAEDDHGVKSFNIHPLRVSAACNRVPVDDGPTECVSVRFARRTPAVTSARPRGHGSLHTGRQGSWIPVRPTACDCVHEEPDSPQPRLHRYYQDEAGVSVGRVGQSPVMDI